MTVENMQKTSSWVEKAKQWLLTNKYGQWVLLALAPIRATPDLFSTAHDGEKPLYVQFKPKKVVFVAASAFTALMTQGLSATFKTLHPNFEGVSGAEYSSALDLIRILFFIFCWFNTVGMIWLYGSLRWWGHGFVTLWSKRVGTAVVSVSKAYFILAASSVVFWFGIYIRLLVMILPVYDPTKPIGWINYLTANPWALLLLIVTMYWLINWVNAIRYRVTCQLYSTPLCSFFMSLGTALSFVFSVIAISYVGGWGIDFLLSFFPEAMPSTLLEHLYTLFVVR